MKVLVTGATGFTGNKLVEKLINKGNEVSVFVRDKSRLSSSNVGRMTVFEGDITDKRIMRQAVEDVDVVYHIAALFRQAGVADKTYWDVNQKAVENFIKISHRAGVKRFVHCSTVGVHGHIEEDLADEEYRLLPGDIYQETKLAGEETVLNYYRETGFPVAVVRPGPIYGPGDMRLLKLFKLAHQKYTPILGDGEVFFNMVYVDDLADIFILAGTKEEAIGEVFLGAGPENWKLNKIVDSISTILKRPAKRFHLPATPFQLAGTLCEKICVPFNIEPPIYRRRVDFFTKSRSFRIDKARKLLGWNPEFCYNKGLKATADWYQTEGLL